MITQTVLSEKGKEEIVEENNRRWAEALESGNAEAVAALYATDDPAFAFLPTLQKGLVADHEGTQEYFRDHFLPKLPKAKFLDQRVRFFNDDGYVQTGFYVFTLKEGNIVSARFTYVWEKRNGEWKILFHHSSLEPA